MFRSVASPRPASTSSDTDVSTPSPLVGRASRTPGASLTASAALALAVAIAGGATHAAAPADAAPSTLAAIQSNIPALNPPVQHPGAPVPQAFSPEEYGWYLSDLSSHPFGIYADVIAGFNDVRANHPDTMKSNLDQVIAINNKAENNPELIHRAQSDAHTEQEGVLRIFSDAFGQKLGAEFRQALEENRLPKTTMLFGGVIARAGGLADSTFAEKELYNNPRPFVVAPGQIKEYAVNGENLYPSSKSFPSGHTNQAAWTTTLLAAMLPELAPQLLARGSEAGYNRIVLGVHYPLDVMGGRMTGTAGAADRWNDPRMRANLQAAAQEIRAELEWRCGDTLANCIARDTPYSQTPVKDYTERMNYGFTPIYNQEAPMIVPQAAPDLLLGAFPNLNYQQRASIIAQTAGPAGMPIDDQTSAGSWERINLAAAMTATIKIADDGTVHVTGSSSPSAFK